MLKIAGNQTLKDLIKSATGEVVNVVIGDFNSILESNYFKLFGTQKELMKYLVIGET